MKVRRGNQHQIAGRLDLSGMVNVSKLLINVVKHGVSLGCLKALPKWQESEKAGCPIPLSWTKDSPAKRQNLTHSV